MYELTFQGVARLCGCAAWGIIIFIMDLGKTLSDFISALRLKPLCLIDLPSPIRRNDLTLKTRLEPNVMFVPFLLFHVLSICAPPMLDPWQVRPNCVVFSLTGCMSWCIFHVANLHCLPTSSATQELMSLTPDTSVLSHTFADITTGRKWKVGFKRNMKQIWSSARLLVCREEHNRYAKYIPMHSAARQRTFKPSLHTCVFLFLFFL